MKTSRIHLDWNGIEYAKGKYNLEQLKEKIMANHKLGLKTFVLIGAIDSGNTLNIPDYLRSAPDEPHFKPGLHFGHSDVYTSYINMLKKTVPIILKYGGYALAIGNEPHGWLEENSNQVANLITFTKKVYQAVKKINKKLAVTLTVEGGDKIKTSSYFKKALNYMDFASINTYCLDSGIGFRQLENEKDLVDLDLHLKYSGDREIIYQEFGCPFGYQDKASPMGITNNQDTVEWIRLAYEKINRNKRVRATYFFNLVDWSPATTDLFIDSLSVGDEIDSLWVQRLREWSLTTGVISFDGTEIRRSYTHILQAIEDGLK
jgi:hypothetical protein